MHRLAWVAHQLPSDPRHLFDAKIFHPAKETLAWSDAMLLVGAIGTPFSAARHAPAASAPGEPDARTRIVAWRSTGRASALQHRYSAFAPAPYVPLINELPDFPQRH